MCVLYPNEIGYPTVWNPHRFEICERANRDLFNHAFQMNRLCSVKWLDDSEGWMEKIWKEAVIIYFNRDLVSFPLTWETWVEMICLRIEDSSPRHPDHSAAMLWWAAFFKMEPGLMSPVSTSASKTSLRSMVKMEVYTPENISNCWYVSLVQNLKTALSR
jgi:hypothetical protein